MLNQAMKLGAAHPMGPLQVRKLRTICWIVESVVVVVVCVCVCVCVCVPIRVCSSLTMLVLIRRNT
jgi:hypothetical protein